MLELDRIICGDCLDVLKTLPEDSVDAIVTDPPAGIAFMGKEWDKDKGGRDAWIAWMSQVAGECLRVIKPGGHALVWALPRTSHWTGMAWEEAGWEPRDKIAHVFGSGFPKSLDISKALDKLAGAEREIIPRVEIDGSVRSGDCSKGWKNSSNNGLTFDKNPITQNAKQWAGWGSALKPAHEDWWLFRKPLSEKTIAANVLRWGCGALNIDGCRVGFANHADEQEAKAKNQHGDFDSGQRKNKVYGEDLNSRTNYNAPGRFPANLIHDGSPEVLAEFAKAGERKCGKDRNPAKTSNSGFTKHGIRSEDVNYGDTGSAARFFQACPFTEEDIPAFLYYAKASRSEREKGLDGMPILAAKNHTTGNNGEGDRRTIGRATTLEKSPLRMAKNSHPTIKPLSLMRYLCRLITPPGGLILDPFAGSGTTCMAAKAEGFHYIGIEREAEYAEIARRRIAAIPTSLSRWVEDARQ